jgi:hypothetical protein
MALCLLLEALLKHLLQALKVKALKALKSLRI